MAQDIVWPSSGGGGGGGNAAAGPTGTPVPTDADFVGFKDGSGNLVGVSAATPLPVTLESEVGTLSVNLTQVGGASVTLGQKTESASIPVTIASDQSAVPASQSGTWTNTVTQTTASNLNAAVVGVGSAGTPSGGVVSVQGVSGGTALPVSMAAVPTGGSTSALQSSVQGTVTPGTAATNSNLSGMVYNSSTQAPTNGQQLALQSDLYGNLEVSHPDLVITGAATQTATVNNILTNPSGTAATNVDGYRTALVQVISTGTGGTFIFEGSNDNVNFAPILVYNVGAINTAAVSSAITATASNLIYGFAASANFIRLRIVSTITGGSIQAFTRLSQDTLPIPVQIAGGQLNLVAGVTTVATVTSVTAVASVTSSQTAIPGTVTDQVSAAINTTTTTAAITPSFGSSYSVTIPVTVVSGTNPTMAVQIQESEDAGTNWFTTYTFPTITATGFYNSPILPLQGNRIRYVQTIGGTATPTFTRSIVRLQSSTHSYNAPTGTIYVDRSGSTSGTPSTSTQVAAYNQQRRYFVIQNLSSSATIYVNFTSAASTTNSLQLLPGGSYTMEASTISTEVINVLSTVASVPFAAKEG